FHKYFITSPFKGLKILFFSIYIESVGSIVDANFAISSLLNSFFINPNVAPIVAPMSAVELAIPLPTGILLFIFKDIFLLSSIGILNFLNTASMAFLDFDGPIFILFNFSSTSAVEYKSIAYEQRYSSLSTIP